MNASGMSNLEVWLIILLVIGVIFSNIAVLKYSAKFKMPQFGDPKKPDNTPKVKSDEEATAGTTDKPADVSDADTPKADSPAPTDTKQG